MRAPRTASGTLAAALTAALVTGCAGTVMDTGGHGSAGTGGGGGGVAGTSAVSTGGGAGGSTPAATCAGSPVSAPRRLVRLSFNQLGNAVRDLFGPAAAASISTKFEIGDPTQRTFPALTSPREGTSFTDAVWSKADGIASAAGQYVADNFRVVTGCATATDPCAQAYLAKLAAKAYRRPLDAREGTSLQQVYTDVKTGGGTVVEATQSSVYATLDAPQFLYRSELGAGAQSTNGGPVALTPMEVASQLSFFLADAPPDAPLLAAAASGALSTPTGLQAEVDRLLATDAVRTNLEEAMFSYFSIANLDNVVIDPAKFPTYNVGLRNAMYRESQEFLNTVLWSGRVEDLLTSRRTVVNPDLATLYGVSVPAGTAADAFVPVELPAARAGLLTQAGFLTARARTDKDSVVARGLLVLSTMLCSSIPPPPEVLKDAIAAAQTSLADKTERDKALYRDTTAPCSSCHQNFDAYGLVLEPFDAIGRYRSVDEKGRAIDPSGTLPSDAGGGTATDVADFARKLADNGAFATCMARNVMRYALADVTTGNVEKRDCAVQAVSGKFLAGTDHGFAALVRQVALSETLALRSGGL